METNKKNLSYFEADRCSCAEYGDAVIWKSTRKSYNASVLVTGPIKVGQLSKKIGDQLNSAFMHLKPMLQFSDMTIGGLCDDGQTGRLLDGDSVDKFCEALRSVGFDAVTTGGALKTEETRLGEGLIENQVIPVNVDGKNWSMVEINGICIGMVTCTVNRMNSAEFAKQQVAADIGRLKAQGSDFILCFLYWEKEGDCEKLCSELAELGVNYIVGSNGQSLMPVRRIRCADGRVVPAALSVGCVLSVEETPDTANIILDLNIRKDPYGSVSVEDRYLPCFTYNGEKRRLIPVTNREWVTASICAEIKKHMEQIETVLQDSIRRCVRLDVPELMVTEQPLPAFKLQKATEVQNHVLDYFRYTEEFRDRYGDHVLRNHPNGQSVRSAVRVLRRCKKVDVADKTLYANILKDLIYSRMVLGFYYYEYFAYDFDQKTIAQRLEYLSEQQGMKYINALNPDKDGIRLLRDKYAAYQKFKPYYKREMLMINGEKDRTEFKAFCDQFPRFMIKPNGRFSGEGVKIVNLRDYENADAMFEDMLTMAPLLCEELIVSAESLAQIHPHSVNSVRLYTLLPEKGEPRVGITFIKSGRGGSVVDNAGCGGIFAAVNPATGIIETDGWDEANQGYLVHPDTGFAFKGYQIERWDELTAMCKEMAKLMPGNRLIGWDCALSKDKGWQIVEGNTWGYLGVLQIATKRGMKKELEAFLGL